MTSALKSQLSNILGAPIQKTVPISGGDISRAYLLYTRATRAFCKLHPGREALTMFMAEKNGLQAIASSGTIRTPAVLCCEGLEKGACLVLEYVESKRPSRQDMEKLGHHLASLHKIHHTHFGWEQDNFIGSLPQSNQLQLNWSGFYVRERLIPQLQLAGHKGLLPEKEVPAEDIMVEALKNLTPEVQPSFLHGDLWAGNYLISTDGVPYLIDPATYYGHHEVDIAMACLFGGFDPVFYGAYEVVFPKTDGWGQRQDLYQLYYLLVHLNLFGRSYYPGVSGLLKRYFGTWRPGAGQPGL